MKINFKELEHKTIGELEQEWAQNLYLESKTLKGGKNDESKKL